MVGYYENQEQGVDSLEKTSQVLQVLPDPTPFRTALRILGFTVITVSVPTFQ